MPGGPQSDATADNGDVKADNGTERSARTERPPSAGEEAEVRRAEEVRHYAATLPATKPRPARFRGVPLEEALRWHRPLPAGLIQSEELPFLSPPPSGGFSQSEETSF